MAGKATAAARRADAAQTAMTRGALAGLIDALAGDPAFCALADGAVDSIESGANRRFISAGSWHLAPLKLRGEGGDGVNK